jgi:non-ribosomal peptide synthetase component E (peptide arylation enzyme)
LDNPQKTEASFDADGFYRTGDEAHLVNGEYVLDGRLSSDCKFQNELSGIFVRVDVTQD